MDMIEEGGRIARQMSRAGPSPASVGEYLSFRLGAEEYGIDLLKVQEIRSYEVPTRIANAPAAVTGVLNLRGVIMPVVDLRVAFACDRADVDAFTIVIVLNVCRRLVGVVVDSVSDVLELNAAAIRPAPGMASTFDTRFINGIASVDKRILILMDVEALMSAPSMGLLAQGVASGAEPAVAFG